MKVSHSVLARFIDVPRDAGALRELLDDVGIEVKRTEPMGQDTVFTVELLANRGDHYCYAGIAREVGGRTGGALCTPESTSLTTGASPVPIHIESDRCARYSLTLLNKVSEGTLPATATPILEAAGLGSVSPPVDATNVANLELGQPTHAFDADTIVGPVRVRDSRPGEQAWLLFTEGPQPLKEGTLVIADDEKILAVAGVIGCEESKSTESTTRVLLESAAFDPVAVRKASRGLNVHTDSSARFERGSDPSLVLVGAGRVVHLMEQAGWAVVGTTGLEGTWEDEARIVAIDIPNAAAFLEYPLTLDTVRERLVRYGFLVSPPYPEWHAEDGWSAPESLTESSRNLRNTLLVRVPPHRVWDVSYPADLYEELAKSIGYNETPAHLPPVDLGALPTRLELAREAVEDVLVAAGFYEVFTDGFYGRDLVEKASLPEDHVLQNHVSTLNAVDRGYSLLKNTAVHQAVDAVSTNLRMRTDEVKAYEWTRTFHPDSEAVATERALLWGICSGHASTPSWDGAARPADAFFVKGLIANMATALRVPLALDVNADMPIDADLLHPSRRAAIVLDGEVVGVVGEVHPRVLRGHRIKRARPVYFQLEQRAIAREPAPIVYAEPSPHHPIQRSLAFALPSGVQAGELAAHLQSTGPAWLASVDIVDEFGLEAGRAVTFALAYDTSTGTRSADEVNAVTEGLIQAVAARFGERGVSLRA